jgi:hypothetical protein
VREIAAATHKAALCAHERAEACSDSIVGSGPAPEAYDQVVVDYTGVSEATGKIYAGSKNFSFEVGNPESLVWILDTVQYQKIAPAPCRQYRIFCPGSMPANTLALP